MSEREGVGCVERWGGVGVLVLLLVLMLMLMARLPSNHAGAIWAQPGSPHQASIGSRYEAIQTYSMCIARDVVLTALVAC